MSTYRPRRGSISLHKRVTHRVVPSVRNLFKSFYAIKVGMTHVKTQKGFTPVTILQIPFHKIVGYTSHQNNKKIETIEPSGAKKYLIQIVFSSVPSNMNKTVTREVPCMDEIPADIGQYKIPEFNVLNVTGVTKGKGFVSVIKRWGLPVKKRKHKRSGKLRHIGSLSPRTPSWVTWRAPQAGRMGSTRRTYRTLSVIKIPVLQKMHDSYGNIDPTACFYVRGSVPGPSKRVILCQIVS